MRGRRSTTRLPSFDALLAECVERGDQTDNDSVWLGAIRTQLEIRRRRREFLSLYGLLPRGYGQIQLQERLGELIAGVTGILERHSVSEDVLRDIDALRDAEERVADESLTPRLLPPKEVPKARDGS